MTGCGVSDAKLPETNFIMEFIADLDGNIEITNLDYPELADKVSEMVLCLENDGSFTLKDKTKNQEWDGTYTAEKIDDSWKLEIRFDDFDKIVNGVYGFRKYQNEEEIPSITLDTEKNIISFIAQR